jgi:flagellin-like hook-associated protein FlgL
VQDLDYAKAIADMNKQMLSLEAAQSSFSKISQMSLFQYLR